MKILFIQPSSSTSTDKNSHRSFLDKFVSHINIHTPPLAFPILAAFTPGKHSITMIDERTQKIDFSEIYDLVGITAMTHQAPHIYEIADEFRDRNIPVVLGGCHPSILPEEAKQHADSVVVGEADEIWPKLLNDLENKDLKPFYYQTRPSDLNKLPLPRKDIVNEFYLAGAIQSSRGCPHGCKFCFVSNLGYGRTYRKRSINNIIEEIRNTPQKLLLFYDTSLTIDVNHTKALFKAMKGLNKKFDCLGNVNVLCKDDELLRLSKEAGCIQWSIGFESISQRVLDDIGKTTNKVENYTKVIDKIHEHGMAVHGFFIIGFDSDQKDVFDKTLDFVRTSGLDSADFSILIPFPGTPIFDQYMEEGRILTKDWSKYQYQENVVYKPKNFTEEELLEGVQHVYEAYYSYSDVFHRFRLSLKRGITNFHPFLFILQNVFTRFYYLKRII